VNFEEFQPLVTLFDGSYVQVLLATKTTKYSAATTTISYYEPLELLTAKY